MNTAIEAKTTGANTTFSPVCDLNLNWRNPLVNVRGISDDAIARIQAIKDKYIPSDDAYPELTDDEKAYVKDVGRRVG